MVNFFALAENESKARVKFNLVEKMLQPCGPPPEKKSEDLAAAVEDDIEDVLQRE